MTNRLQTTTHDETTPRIAAYSSLVSVAAFLVLLIVLYFLEPEFNPPRLISEYELGRFGFLMSLAFFCLGAGSLFLARALWIDLRTKSDRFGGWWLIFVGIAYIGVAGFALVLHSLIIFYGLGHRSNIAVVGWTNRFMIAAYCAGL